MPRPTEQQLNLINSRFSQTPLIEDNCFVFPNLMIDNLTSYFSIIQPALLNTFMENVKNGIALLLVHNNRKLPVGRSFDARIKSEYVADYGKDVLTLYGDFYVPLGITLENGISTDDIAKGIDTGINFATSIGFSADKWTCSICGNDYRDYYACPHFAGKKYAVERNGQDVVETCHVLVGEDGNGSLNEDSLVYAGACNRAGIIANFSKSVNDSNISPNLYLIEELKNIPKSTTIYQYFTKDGSVLFTKTDKRTEGMKYINKRSEEIMELEKIIEILGKYNIKFSKEAEFETALKAITDTSAKFESVKTELSTANAELDEVKSKVEKAEADLAVANESITAKDETIQELTTKNEELTEKAGLADTYKKDLIEQALEAGIKAQGNAFQKEMFEKFLGALSVDEIKKVAEGFKAEFMAKFEGTKVTKTKKDGELSKNSDKEPTCREDFETDEEFRDFIADKAVEYAREQKTSIKEATKILYLKYSKEE